MLGNPIYLNQDYWDFRGLLGLHHARKNPIKSSKIQ